MYTHPKVLYMYRYAPIADGTNGSEGISPLQCLKRAFEMLNVSGTGRLNKADFKSLLQTLEVLPINDDNATEREVCYGYTLYYSAWPYYHNLTVL
jgi:hypothetical protein